MADSQKLIPLIDCVSNSGEFNRLSSIVEGETGFKSQKNQIVVVVGETRVDGNLIDWSHLSASIETRRARASTQTWWGAILIFSGEKFDNFFVKNIYLTGETAEAAERIHFGAIMDPPHKNVLPLNIAA